MKKFKLFIVSAIIISFLGCSANERARRFGETETILLPKNKKLITVTWKELNLWYLVRERHPDEPIETYHFAEKSASGLLEGVVVLKEQ